MTMRYACVLIYFPTKELVFEVVPWTLDVLPEYLDATIHPMRRKGLISDWQYGQCLYGDRPFP
jgi:hypothetical protein